MRTALMILAVIQIAWPAGLALLTGSADGMTGWGLAALLGAQAVGAAGLVVLVQTEHQFSRQPASRATVPLAISLAANLVLAVTNLLGVTAGHWCLPLVLGLIPTIGLVQAYWNLRQTPTDPYLRSAAPVGATPGSQPSRTTKLR